MGNRKKQLIGASAEESVKALNKAFDLGLNFIDTALGYGYGHSERLVKSSTIFSSKALKISCFRHVNVIMLALLYGWHWMKGD